MPKFTVTHFSAQFMKDLGCSIMCHRREKDNRKSLTCAQRKGLVLVLQVHSWWKCLLLPSRPWPQYASVVLILPDQQNGTLQSEFQIHSSVMIQKSPYYQSHFPAIEENNWKYFIDVTLNILQHYLPLIICY